MKIYNHDETLSTEFEIFIPEYEVGREECYIRTCFYALKSLLWMWRHPMFPHSVRCLPRLFYGMVHSYKSNGIPTGLTSDLYGDPDKMTDDHKNSPQTVGEFVLDRANICLNDYEIFKRVFLFSCETNRIYKTENTALSKLKNQVPTIYKYQEVGKEKYDTKWNEPIRLFDIQTREEVSNLIGPRTFVYDGFWEDFCEWEPEMVLEEFSSFGKPLPEHIKCSQKKVSVSSLKTFF
jgi:hypothetical protein